MVSAEVRMPAIEFIIGVVRGEGPGAEDCFGAPSFPQAPLSPK